MTQRGSDAPAVGSEDQQVRRIPALESVRGWLEPRPTPLESTPRELLVVDLYAILGAMKSLYRPRCPRSSGDSAEEFSLPGSRSGSVRCSQKAARLVPPLITAMTTWGDHRHLSAVPE